MLTRRSHIFIVEPVCALLLLLFAYTGLTKIFDVAALQAAIAEAPLLKTYSYYLKWMLPVTELLCAVLLFIPFTRWTGLLFAALLLTLFSCYILYLLWIPDPLPCRCIGITEKLSWKSQLIVNGSFLIPSLVSIYLIAINRRSRTPVEHSRQKFYKFLKSDT